MIYDVDSMDYTVLVHRAEEGGYWTEVPSFSGCYSQGDTVEEAIENTKEAVKCHLLALREEGVRMLVKTVCLLQQCI